MKNIITYILLLISVSVYAQKQVSVHLKNGNSFIGVLCSKDSNTIKLLGRDLNTYVFDTSEIREISSPRFMKIASESMREGYVHDLSISFSMAGYRGTVYPYGLKFNYSFERVFNYKHSLGAECILFINDDFAPTLGIKYRYSFLSKPSTPFLSIGAGNYADPFWSIGIGSRVNASLGYQWGTKAFRRQYIVFDVSKTNAQYNGPRGEKLNYSTMVYSIGFGFRL